MPAIRMNTAAIQNATQSVKNDIRNSQMTKRNKTLSAKSEQHHGFAKKGSKEDEARMQKEREARRAARAAAVQGEGSSSGKPAVKRRETKVGKLGSSSREGSDNKVLTLTQKLSRQGTDMGLNKIAKTTDDSKKKEEDGKLKLSEEAVDKLLEMADIFFNVKSSIMEQTQIIDEQEEIIAECEYAVDCLEKLNSTTQLLWKISDFGLKCKKKILYSPAFATHNQGYQIALSLCPQGDGRAKGRYMSIFFCILHGPWDGLLSWPFTHTLTFTVVDQNPDESKRRDLSVSFTPNPNPQSMQFLTKPTSQRNASLGLPRFVPIADIWNGTYIVEDNLFIKVTVDLTDIPRL